MDAHDWDERYAGAELVWSAAPNVFVESELGDLPPGDALDLAAGEGRNALWLASLGWRVTAVDFSQAALDKGRATESAVATDHPVGWVCADVLAWEGLDRLDHRQGPDHRDHGWDLVVVAYLQLPEDQRTAAVRRGFRALRPGGTLLWVAHDATNLVEGTGGPQDPDVLMSAEDVLSDLGDEDFEIIRAERVSRTVEPGHGGEPERAAYDCLVRLRRPV